jgi:hypothetical protein
LDTYQRQFQRYIPRYTILLDRFCAPVESYVLRSATICSALNQSSGKTNSRLFFRRMSGDAGAPEAATVTETTNKPTAAAAADHTTAANTTETHTESTVESTTGVAETHTTESTGVKTAEEVSTSSTGAKAAEEVSTTVAKTANTDAHNTDSTKVSTASPKEISPKHTGGGMTQGTDAMKRAFTELYEKELADTPNDPSGSAARAMKRLKEEGV